MTLLFGILNQNKDEEPLRYRVTYNGTAAIPAPVVTAHEAEEMRMEEFRRVLNRNNVPTAAETNRWDRAFHAMRRWEVANVRGEERAAGARDVYATMEDLRARGRNIIDDLRAAVDYAQPEADQANGG